MNLSDLTLLSLQWLEAIETASDEGLEIAQERLEEYLVSVGNTPGQVEYWMAYSVEMAAYEEESIESVLETEVAIARMQGKIL